MCLGSGECTEAEGEFLAEGKYPKSGKCLEPRVNALRQKVNPSLKMNCIKSRVNSLRLRLNFPILRVKCPRLRVKILISRMRCLNLRVNALKLRTNSRQIG